MASEPEPRDRWAGRPDARGGNRGRWAAAGVAAVGCLGIGLAWGWGGESAAALGLGAALMLFVTFWESLALGWWGGLVSALVCVAIAAAMGIERELPGALALPTGLVAAGLGGLAVRGREGRLRERAEAAAGEAGVLRGELGRARGEVAALQRRLRESERLALVGTAAAQVAHQFRNPLTSIQLYVQLLGDELRRLVEPERTDALGVLELVLNELGVLVEITDNYLQYARLPELEPAPLDLNRTVGELVRFLGPEIARKGLVASTRFAEGLPPVAADRRLLRFALMNLLKNAVEAMGPGGRLRVKTCQENGSVEVHVSDTGPGIPPSERERIFEPFYSTKESGSGLGLALSRQIVEKHNGSLTCQSMVGVGTTFIIRLPPHAQKSESER